MCAGGKEIRGRCTLIDRRYAERRKTESRDLFYRCQVVHFSRPRATLSSVRIFPAFAVSVTFGQSLVAPGCYQSQPSSTLSSSGSSQINSLTRRSFEKGLLGTTNDREFKCHFSSIVDFELVFVPKFGRDFR